MQRGKSIVVPGNLYRTWGLGKNHDKLLKLAEQAAKGGKVSML
jgi:hypothetical protein